VVVDDLDIVDAQQGVDGDTYFFALFRAAFSAVTRTWSATTAASGWIQSETELHFWPFHWRNETPEMPP